MSEYHLYVVIFEDYNEETFHIIGIYEKEQDIVRCAKRNKIITFSLNWNVSFITEIKPIINKDNRLYNDICEVITNYFIYKNNLYYKCSLFLGEKDYSKLDYIDF